MNPWEGNQLSSRLGQITGLNNPNPLTLSGQLQDQFDEIKQRPFQYRATPKSNVKTEWDTPNHPADTMGGIARYGAPGQPGIINFFLQMIMQSQVEKQYPGYDWRNAPNPKAATQEQIDAHKNPPILPKEPEPVPDYRPTAWAEGETPSGESWTGYRPTAWAEGETPY
jgi:hypothetical protein